MSGNPSGAMMWEVDMSPSAPCADPAASGTATRSSVSSTTTRRGAGTGQARGSARRGLGGSTVPRPVNTASSSTALPRLPAAVNSTSTGARGSTTDAAGRLPASGTSTSSKSRGGGTASSSATLSGVRRVPTTTKPSGSTALTRAQTRPMGVVQTLHEREMGPGVSAKSRAVQDDLRDLADDYFGGAESRAPERAAEGGSGLLPGVSEGAFDSSLSKVKSFYTESAVPPAWLSGPANTEGRMFDASDSNLLCMDVLASVEGGGVRRGTGSANGQNAFCVVGSADHGLKVFDLATLQEKKTLFNRANGHSEWVTCCRFFPDGRVLSGGMDSKLCLWDCVLGGGSMARCQDLLGHTASVSQVEVNGRNQRAVSASYDRTLRIWDCTSIGREAGVLAGHKAPVMQFDWCGVQILSGDRQGQAKVWDLERAKCLCTMATKRGQIGAVQQFYHDAAGELTMFGDQGGVLTVLDLRQGKKPIAQREVHPGGVLSGIRGVHTAATLGSAGADTQGTTGGGRNQAASPLVVTCGADKRICVLEPRCGFAPVHTFTDHKDFIYSMETFGPLIASGAGNGWVLVHDSRTGECCYGLGAGENAIRDVFAAPQFLVAAGDDGKAVVYDF